MKLLLLLTLILSGNVAHTERVVVTTRGDLAYNFFPLCTNYLEFNVSGARDFHVILTNSYSRDKQSYEILIGGADNTKSIIRKDLQDKVNYDGTIVQDGVYQKFWVAINDTDESVSFGKERGKPLIRFNDPNFVKMSYFGVSSGAGIYATWDFDFEVLAACSCLSSRLALNKDKV